MIMFLRPNGISPMFPSAVHKCTLGTPILSDTRSAASLWIGKAKGSPATAEAAGKPTRGGSPIIRPNRAGEQMNRHDGDRHDTQWMTQKSQTRIRRTTQTVKAVFDRARTDT